MSRYIFLTASVEVQLPAEFDDAPQRTLDALALGVTVEWSGYPDGSRIRTAGPRVGRGVRLNGSNPAAGWQT